MIRVLFLYLLLLISYRLLCTKSMSSNIPKTEKKRIVIVGGGFGGLILAERLKKSPYQVVLIDKYNYHQFPPLLYQVSTSGLEPSAITFPYRKIFQRRKDFYFRMAEVFGINSDEKSITTSIGKISYDYLVLAAGTDSNYFGNDDLNKYTFPMKNIPESLTLRNRLLQNLENALTADNPAQKQSLLNIAIVGGGATGVEIAGAIAEMKRYILPKDYPDLNVQDVNIFLIEGSDRILRSMSLDASQKAQSFLEDMGVTVKLNTIVDDYDGKTLRLKNGSTWMTSTVIWCSGVRGVSFTGLAEEVVVRGGRVRVDQYNEIDFLSGVFAIGDICFQQELKYPNGYPQVAPVAIQQGKHLAKNFERIAQGKPMLPFSYKDKGSMATVGRNRAVVDLYGFNFGGLTAWILWMTVHLMSILGVKNKIIVLLNWIWNYFTYDQSLRLIIKPSSRHKK